MEKIIMNNKVIFIGKVKDIKNLFAGFPPGSTLLEYISFNLH